MKKSKSTRLVLFSLIALGANSLCLINLATQTEAATDRSLDTTNSKHSSSSKDQTITGLNQQISTLINKGLWLQAIQSLEDQVSHDTYVGAPEAWLAFAYLYQGKHTELAEFVKKMQTLQVNPDDTSAAKIVNAYGLISAGKLDEAENVLNTLASDSENDLSVTFAKACVALKRGNAKKAAQYCEKAVAISPNFAWGYRTLGFIQEKSLKNPQLAERAYERALALSSNFKDVRDLLVDLRLSKNDFDGAVSTACEAIKLYPRDPVNYYRLAQIYIQQWRLNESLQQLEKAVQLDKTDPRFHRSMAAIYRYQNKFVEAITEQKRAVELSKDKVFEQIELANLYEISSNISESIEVLKKARELQQAGGVAQQKLITLLKKEKKFDELVTEYKLAIEKDSKNANLHFSLAEALNQLGKTEDALAELKESANLDQRNPKPHREIAKIELAKKDYLAAAKSYTRALNINPGSVEDLVALGYCYASNYDFMPAETAFVTGLALQQLGQSSGNPSQVNPFDIMRSLASVLYSEGRYREAVVNLEAVFVADKDPQQKALDRFSLAEAKAMRDRNSDSIKELQNSFSSLDKNEQLQNLDLYADVLINLNKIDLFVSEMKKFPEPDLKTEAPLVCARLMLHEGRIREAKDLTNEILANIKDDPDTSSEIYLLISDIYTKDQDPKSAHDALVKAAEIAPKSFLAHVRLSRSLLAQKKYTEAQIPAQRALEINPYCVPAYIALSESLIQNNKLKEAESNLTKACELYPTSLEAHKSLLVVLEKLGKAQEAAREKEIISHLSKSAA